MPVFVHIQPVLIKIYRTFIFKSFIFKHIYCFVTDNSIFSGSEAQNKRDDVEGKGVVLSFSSQLYFHSFPVFVPHTVCNPCILLHLLILCSTVRWMELTGTPPSRNICWVQAGLVLWWINYRKLRQARATEIKWGRLKGKRTLFFFFFYKTPKKETC